MSEINAGTNSAGTLEQLSETAEISRFRRNLILEFSR